jgi:hypothetical protein
MPSTTPDPPELPALRDGRPPPAAVAAVADLAASLSGRVPVLTARLVTAITASDTAYAEAAVVPVIDLERAVSGNLAEAVAVLARGGTDPARGAASARATGQRRAEQGLPLVNLLHAYRLGGQVIWSGLVEECLAREPPPIRELMEGATLVWSVVDALSGEIADAYRAAETEMAARRRSHRQTVLRSLLTGMMTDVDDIAAAARTLDAGDGPFIVAVADMHADASSIVRALTAALAAAGCRSEWVAHQDRQVALIMVGRHNDVREVQPRLEAAARTQIGLSPPVASLSQVHAAHGQAELALRSIPAGRIGVAALDDRLISALLAASPELARRLARRTLGAVLEFDAPERDMLLRTLRVYLETGGPMAAAAQRMSCHPNTVFNRLRRVQELTGLAVSKPMDAAQLLIALTAVELIR